MKKIVLNIVFASVIAGVLRSSSAAVEIVAAYVADGLGARRTTFSSTERITLKAEVYNAAPSDRIDFIFVIYDALGSKLMEHTGNSVPGPVGAGGSSLSAVQISRFYKSPGSYVYELRANEIRGGAVVDSKSTRASFFVYSPILTLAYPPNNAMNLADSPLVFRWAGSGSVKYRISVDDDMSFYNTIFSAETLDTFYSYPQNPSDIRQRLNGSRNYFWKVEGLDAFGNVIAASQMPFVFTIKDTASSRISRDIGIVSAAIEPSDETSALIKVEIKNLGARGESNVPVTLFVDGTAVGSLRIDFLNAGQSFIAEFRAPRPKSEKIVVTAAHNFIDDTPANNMLTLTLALPREIAVTRGSIIGKVLEYDGDKSKDNGITGAAVSYVGPVSGEVKTAKNGQYQIHDLPPGAYKLSVTHPDHEPADASVELTRARAYSAVDFRLKTAKKAATSSTAMIRGDFWNGLRRYLSASTLDKTEGYELSEISGVPESGYADILEALKNGNARITNETLE